MLKALSIGAFQDLMESVLDGDFRVRWWRQLEQEQPEVAARLVAKFPDRYPVRAQQEAA